MGGTSRVTDVEGWVLLERNSVQKFFFQKILYEWSLWSNVLLLCFRTVFFFFFRHIPNKMKVSILVHFILRGFADVCAASKARRTIVSDTFPQLCNGHVFLQFPWTYHPSEKLTSPFPPGCAQNGKAPHAWWVSHGWKRPLEMDLDFIRKMQIHLKATSFNNWGTKSAPGHCDCFFFFLALRHKCS